MSTRGYIYVMTRKETMGKTIKCRKAASPLPCMFRDHSRREPFKPAPLREVPDSIFVESETICKPYLGIYNQCDSYVDGIGRALVEHFKTYEQALNLVAGGMTESIGGHIIYEPERRPDKGDTPAWDGLSITPLQEDEPTGVESYQYLFYEGRWYVRKSRSYWYDVAELLAALEGTDAMNVAACLLEADETEGYKEYRRNSKDFTHAATDEEHDRLLDEDMALYDRLFHEPWSRMLPEGDNLHHPTPDRIAAAVAAVEKL